MDVTSAHKPQYATQLATGPYATLTSLIELQRLAPLIPLKRQRRHLNTQSGGQLSSQRGRGMEFAEVRPYIAGDDIRAMDWKVTARTGKAHTKLYQEERERHIMIACDQSRSLFFGSRLRTKSHCAAQVAALLGWSALANQDRVGALLFNDQQEKDFRPTGKARAYLNILSNLEQLNQMASEVVYKPKDWCIQLQHLNRIVKPGSQVYWISDMYGFNQATHHWLSLIRRHCDITIVLISDPLEQALPDAGMLTFTGGRLSGGQQQVVLDTGSQKVRDAFQQQMSELSEVLQSTCRKMGIPVISLKTNDNLLNSLRLGLGVGRALTT
jgi:uncharacterized protein (DUF58 family)